MRSCRKTDQIGNAESLEDSMPTTYKMIAWQTNLDNALKTARGEQRLVLLDFSAAPT